jgi:hypothetical protein
VAGVEWLGELVAFHEDCYSVVCPCHHDYHDFHQAQHTGGRACHELIGVGYAPGFLLEIGVGLLSATFLAIGVLPIAARLEVALAQG